MLPVQDLRIVKRVRIVNTVSTALRKEIAVECVSRLIFST